jgi:gamma-glutamylcyclotransferase (GGCT)/AIG2-like uncharacterized protein YtfP
MFDFPCNRLAAYGTLRPGQPNNSELDGIEGRWSKGTVCGSLVMKSGCSGFHWNNDTSTSIEVDIFTARNLQHNWARLDQFEGPNYERILIPAKLLNNTIVIANIFELAHGKEPFAKSIII